MTWTNKRHEQSIADNFPASCAECGQNIFNFEKTEKSTGIGVKVTVKCPMCDHVQDISDYSLW